ncbi:MAG: ribonuclease III [Clostridia bacterium]|nr:ribonuclease III [Clostridia bacterium]
MNRYGTDAAPGGRAPAPDAADPTVDALSYLGDSVYELIIRERLVKLGICGSSRLNSEARKYVTAPAQSAAAERLLPLLTEEEEAVFRRGRNSGHGKNIPKTATAAEYRRATGLETLFGMLRLEGRDRRADELVDAAFPELRI